MISGPLKGHLWYFTAKRPIDDWCRVGQQSSSAYYRVYSRLSGSEWAFFSIIYTQNFGGNILSLSYEQITDSDFMHRLHSIRTTNLFFSTLTVTQSIILWPNIPKLSSLFYLSANFKVRSKSLLSFLVSRTLQFQTARNKWKWTNAPKIVILKYEK